MHKGKDWTVRKNEDEEEREKGIKGQGRWQAKEDQAAAAAALQKWITCPICNFKVMVDGMRLHNGYQFSNLMCRRCTRTTNCELWRCACGERWNKCSQHHELKFNMHETHPGGWAQADAKNSRVKGRRLVKTKAEKAIPRKRVHLFEADVHCTSVMGGLGARKTLRLKATSKYAKLFPHLVDPNWF